MCFALKPAETAIPVHPRYAKLAEFDLNFERQFYDDHSSIQHYVVDYAIICFDLETFSIFYPTPNAY
jgi:hypothetical protein